MNKSAVSRFLIYSKILRSPVLNNMYSSSFWRHPFILVLSLYVTFGLVLVFTPPRPSHRIPALIILIFQAAVAFRVADQHALPEGTVDFTVGTAAGILLYGSHHFCLNAKARPEWAKTLRQKAVWVIRDILSNPRGELPSHRLSRVYHSPTERGHFIVMHCVRLVGFWAIRRLYLFMDERLFWAQIVAGDFTLFNRERQSFFRRAHEVVLREYLIRLWLILQFHVPFYAFLNCVHSLLALVWVGVFQDRITLWPSLFGNLSDAYTLRRYWNHWWQQIHRVAFLSNARFVVYSILRIRNPVVARYLILLVVFLISATIHGLSTKFCGGECDGMPVFRWFLLMCAAIYIEDVMQFISGWVTPRQKYPKAVGFLWVLGFFWWSLPKLYFPNVACMDV